MTTVLVGVNDGDAARDATVLAAALAGADDVLLLAAVRETPRGPRPPATGAAEPTPEQLEATLAEVCAACAPRARTAVLEDRSPAHALRERAQVEPIGLVALGSCRRAGDGEAFAGRTARQVLGDAPCPVALAARGLEPGGFALRRIVVGVEETPEARAACAVAAELAQRAGAQLREVTVPDERDAAEQLAHAAGGADLLVVGSRHWGPRSHVVLGSTAEELLRGAPCSLLLVPRPDDGDA